MCITCLTGLGLYEILEGLACQVPAWFFLYTFEVDGLVKLKD